MRNNRIRILKIWIYILGILCFITGLTDGLKTTKETVNQTKVIKKENIENKKVISEKKEKEDRNIRVLLMTNAYKNIIHPEVTVSAKHGILAKSGEKEMYFDNEKDITILPDSPWFNKGSLQLTPLEGKIKINSMKRGDGIPEYAGMLELRQTAEGIVIINELPVEEYLCGVLPSEMPASYEKEALKAQAVCARSYAYKQMKNYAYKEYKAHVNDSTDYQVYNNAKQDPRATDAVKETKNEVAYFQEKIATTYYFSTSCGKTTTPEAWGSKRTKENAYLQSVSVKGEKGNYEKNLPWYRWEIEISREELRKVLENYLKQEIGEILNIEVAKKGPGDVVCQLKVEGDKTSISIDTENKIRSALGGSGCQIVRADGSKVASKSLLPSAFFKVKKRNNGFVFQGGGFGHGIGMSQTGANEMAKDGKKYREILGFFFQNIEIKKI